jgi:hypothetical protein
VLRLALSQLMPLKRVVNRIRGVLSAYALGIVGTVLLHALLFASTIFGGPTVAPRVVEGSGAVAQGDTTDDAELNSMILLDLSLLAQDNTALEMPAPKQLIDDVSLKLVVDVEEPAYVSFPEADTISDPVLREPTPEDALIFSRYLSQVSARIYRAWLKPRTSLRGATFECRIRVEQDRSGNVQSVEIQNCNGDTAWQESLVLAIERASPLSALPSQLSFSAYLDFKFTSAEYVPGASNENEYRPEAIVSIRASRQPP